MKKLLTIILTLIVSLNITVSSAETPKREPNQDSTEQKVKKHKCKEIGISKLTPKKSMRKNKRGLQRDMKFFAKIKKEEERKNRKNKKKYRNVMPKFRS